MRIRKFQTVEALLDSLPEGEREITLYLRECIWDCIPHCREKLAYNVPFYYRKSPICFLWPATIPWGKTPAGGVKLGFCKGYQLRDDIGYLEREGRRRVYSKTFMDKKRSTRT